MDIEKSFKKLKLTIENTPLPKGHAGRFENRLGTKKKRSRSLYLGATAAVALLCFGLSTVLPPGAPQKQELLKQHYSQQIQKQFQTLEARYGSDFGQPIADIKLKIKGLNLDYLTLQEKFENNPHPLILKAMTENLFQQIELLKNLEEKMNIQKNNRDENKVL